MGSVNGFGSSSINFKREDQILPGGINNPAPETSPGVLAGEVTPPPVSGETTSTRGIEPPPKPPVKPGKDASDQELLQFFVDEREYRAEKRKQAGKDIEDHRKAAAFYFGDDYDTDEVNPDLKPKDNRYYGAQFKAYEAQLEEVNEGINFSKASLGGLKTENKILEEQLDAAQSAGDLGLVQKIKKKIAGNEELIDAHNSAINNLEGYKVKIKDKMKSHERAADQAGVDTTGWKEVRTAEDDTEDYDSMLPDDIISGTGGTNTTSDEAATAAAAGASDDVGDVAGGNDDSDAGAAAEAAAIGAATTATTATTTTAGAGGSGKGTK